MTKLSRLPAGIRLPCEFVLGGSNDDRPRDVVLANLAAWLRQARPDIACLQELRATDSEFPIAAIEKGGYDAVWRGEKSWNGVAILGRGGEPVLTRTGLPGDLADTLA